MNAVLYPLDRVELDGKTIFLGMDWAEAEQVLGTGSWIRGRHYYFNNELAIDCDADNKVCFIEFLGGFYGKIKPAIYDISAFEADAEELAEVLSQKNGGVVRDVEKGHCIEFLKISVGVYRELVPAEIIEMERDMRADGIPTEGNPDLERDRESARHWSSIGIGIAEYYE